MFQSDVQDFCHHKTGEYTVAINVLNNWDLNFTFNVVTILLKSATDRIILFETLILKLKISIVVTCSSYKVKKKTKFIQKLRSKKGNSTTSMLQYWKNWISKEILLTTVLIFQWQWSPLDWSLLRKLSRILEFQLHKQDSKLIQSPTKRFPTNMGRLDTGYFHFPIDNFPLLSFSQIFSPYQIRILYN